MSEAVRARRRRGDARATIIDVAARLLREEGPAAVTTRGVAQGAGVQAPMIYRLFGDKDGLLQAVAEHVMATYVVAKTATVEAAAADDVDPLDDLRAGWLAQIDFAVTNPALFALMSDPARVRHSPAAQAGRRVLESRVHRVAAAGRLCVSEQQAVDLITGAGIGTVMTLLSAPTERTNPTVAHDMYEAVLRQILADPPEPGARTSVATVVALRAITPRLDMLSEAERQLLGEWLDRAVASLTT